MGKAIEWKHAVNGNRSGLSDDRLPLHGEGDRMETAPELFLVLSPMPYQCLPLHGEGDRMETSLRYVDSLFK